MVRRVMKFCCALCAVLGMGQASPINHSGIMAVRDLPMIVEELQSLSVVRELIRQQTNSEQPLPKEICPVRDVEVYLGDGWEKWAERKGADFVKALVMSQTDVMDASAYEAGFILTDPDTWSMQQWLVCGVLLDCLDVDLIEGQLAPLVLRLKLPDGGTKRVQMMLDDIYLSKDYLLYGCVSFAANHYNGLECKEFVFEGDKFCARLEAEYSQCKSTWGAKALPEGFELSFSKSLEKWRGKNVSCVLTVEGDSLYIFITSQPAKNVKLPNEMRDKSALHSGERDYATLEFSASLTESVFGMYMECLWQYWLMWRGGFEKNFANLESTQKECQIERLAKMELALKKWLHSLKTERRGSPFKLRCWQKNGLHVECNLEGIARLFNELTTPAILVTERNERDLISVSGRVDAEFRQFYREFVPNFVALATKSLLVDKSPEMETFRMYHQMFGAMIQNLWMAWEYLSQATSEDYELVISQAKQEKYHLQWRLSYVVNHPQKLSDAWQFFDSALRPILPMMLPGVENGLDYHLQNRHGSRVYYSELKDLPFEMPHLTLTEHLWVLGNGEHDAVALPLLKRHEKCLFYLDWNVRGCCDDMLSHRALISPMWYGYLRMLRNDVSRVKVCLGNELKNTGVLRIFMEPVRK